MRAGRITLDGIARERTHDNRHSPRDSNLLNSHRVRIDGPRLGSPHTRIPVSEFSAPCQTSVDAPHCLSTPSSSCRYHDQHTGRYKAIRSNPGFDCCGAGRELNTTSSWRSKLDRVRWIRKTTHRDSLTSLVETPRITDPVAECATDPVVAGTPLRRRDPKHRTHTGKRSHRELRPRVRSNLGITSMRATTQRHQPRRHANRQSTLLSHVLTPFHNGVSSTVDETHRVVLTIGHGAGSPKTEQPEQTPGLFGDRAINRDRST